MEIKESQNQPDLILLLLLFFQARVISVASCSAAVLTAEGESHGTGSEPGKQRRIRARMRSAPRVGRGLLSPFVRSPERGFISRLGRSRGCPGGMFVALNELLGASVEEPERSKLILLCATKTDASFLVHHFLSFYLKARCKVCFLSFVQSFSHYNSVAQKLGANLLTAKEQSQLVFFEGLKSANQVLFGDGQESEDLNPFQFVSGDGSDLKRLYHFVRTSLYPSADGYRGKFPVLIVDDLGVLLSLGVRLTDILNFVHYCRATVNTELKGNLVFMMRSSEDSEDEENELLVKALRHQANSILWAEGLASGYCKEVHGQLTILEKDSRESSVTKDPWRVYQYQIQDKNVAFFARGMSAAVL